MEAWSHAQYAGERERENTETLFKKIMHSISTIYMCVCSMHTLYKSLQGLTEVLSYFNALKERLH